jgi:hypothetical protein
MYADYRKTGHKGNGIKTIYRHVELENPSLIQPRDKIHDFLVIRVVSKFDLCYLK